MSLTQRESRITAAAWAAASLLTFLVYLPVLGHGFVNWDDNEYVYNNPHLKTIDSRFLHWAFTSFHSLNWHPLTWLSHAVDYRLWGLNPWGHHLSSILLHTVNTLLVGVLVFLLLRRALSQSHERQPPPKAKKKVPRTASEGVAFTHLLLPSLVAALLFGIHPLHVESVAWISERKDVLSTFFMLLSVLFYLRHAEFARRQWRGGNWALSLLCFALALMSKPMPLTLPLVFLLLDVYPLKRLTLRIPWSDRLAVGVEKIPFFALGAASALVTFTAQIQGGATGTLQFYPASTRILVALKAIGFYLAGMVAPVGLSPLYPYPRKGEVSLLSTEYLVPTVFFLATSAVCIYLWRRGTRLIATVWLCYLVMLLPVLGIIHFGPQAAADRYTYATLLPVFACAGIGFGSLVEKMRGRRRMVAGLAALAGGIVFVLCLLTVNQSRVWTDSLAVWNRVLALYPDSAVAYNRRGDAYLSLGNDALALADLNRSIELSETPFEPSLYRRGRILLQMGRSNEALKDIDAAILVRPDRADSYNVRGAIYAGKGEPGKAIDDFSRAIDLDSAASEAYNNRGSALRGLGDLERARLDFDRSIELDPGNAEAYNNRALLEASLGDHNRALTDFTKAIELRANFAEAYLNRCEWYRQQGLFEKALVDCTKGVELAGRSAPAHNVRGLVLFAMGRTAEAISEFDKAAEIAPKSAEAFFNRGALLGQLGRFREAIRDFDTALALDSSSGPAYLYRGLARYSSGDRVAALEDFRNAARLGGKEVQEKLEKMGIR